MTTALHLTQENDNYNALPARIRQYLNDRGITDGIIDRHRLGWNGSRITIPISDRDGSIVGCKLAKAPSSSPGC